MYYTPDAVPLAGSTGLNRMQPSASERVELEDGRWFDAKKAISWSEATARSNARRTHQKLYRTRKMAWVLKLWSGSKEGQATYEQVDAGYAVRWLLYNGHTVPKPAFENQGEI